MSVGARGRVGLFGGAFDPPHNAHVALARAAVAQLGLDRLHICPTGDAWHKAHGLGPAADRLAMARLAFADLPNAVVDERELRRTGPTYTIDTLRELQAESPAAVLFLVIGEDQAAGFTRWHAWEAIAGLATIAVAARHHAVPSQSTPELALPTAARVVRLQMPLMDESATDARQRLARGEGIAELVPTAVASYIERHHPYRTR